MVKKKEKKRKDVSAILEINLSFTIIIFMFWIFTYIASKVLLI